MFAVFVSSERGSGPGARQAQLQRDRDDQRVRQQTGSRPGTQNLCRAIMTIFSGVLDMSWFII